MVRGLAKTWGLLVVPKKSPPPARLEIMARGAAEHAGEEETGKKNKRKKMSNACYVRFGLADGGAVGSLEKRLLGLAVYQ
jgi:hypothetical protein